MSDWRCECGHSASRHPYLTATFPDACSDCPCERFTLLTVQLEEGAHCELIGPLSGGLHSSDEPLTPVQLQMRLCESVSCRGERTPCSRCEPIVQHDSRLRAEIERLRADIESMWREPAP